ncbi:MAG: hypothetical protein AAFZ89_09065 [Bacteroidota bacterium]
MTLQSLFKTSLLFVSTTCLFLLIGCIDNFGGGPRKQKETREALGKILQDFVITEEAKDGANHSQLYVSNGSTVNFVLKSNGNPVITNLTRDQWIGFFTSWDYEYFPVYSDIDFTIKRGMALDSHLFQGFRDGQPDLFGNDIFLYVKTPDGWKIVSLSSTITAPDDTTDYDAIGPLEASPYMVFDHFTRTMEQQDFEAFTGLFINETAPCFRFQKEFDVPYSQDAHTASAFFRETQEKTPGGTINFQALKIEIKDQYTAQVSSSYNLKNDYGIVEKGEILATLAGTPTDGWKITAMLFSIK